MKKIYTVFVAALLALVCSMSASAQGGPLNLILNCDRSDVVQWRQTWVEADWRTMQEGDNQITLDYDYGYTLQLRTIDGYRLDAVKSPDSDSYTDLNVSNPLDNNYFYPNASWEGRTYNIVTSDLSEVRSAKLTVNVVDNPNRFTIRRSTGPAVKLPSTGEHEFRFDPATELPLVISAVGSEPLYKVLLDNEPVPLQTNSSSMYELKNLSDGQRLDITSNWPADIKTGVSITVPEGLEGVVTRIARELPNYGGSEDVEFTVNTPFKVQGGSWYSIYLNKNEYVIDKLLINGTSQYVSASSRFWVGDSDVKIDIEAKVKIVPKYYISTPRDNEVEYSFNSVSYMKLPAGETEIVPEEGWGGWTSVYIRPVSGFRLTKLECAEAGDSYEIPENPLQFVQLQPTAEWLGRTYVVEAKNLEEERTASITVTVTDDPAKVVVAKRGGVAIALGEAGEAKTITFNPESAEKNFLFAGSLVPLNSVKVNGQSIMPDKAESIEYTIPVADGDQIEITAGYPETEIPVTINIDADVARAINEVLRYTGTNSYETEEILFTPGEPFNVPAGSKLSIKYDTKYNLKSVKIGDRELQFNSPIFVLNDPVVIDIDAAEWRVLPFTVKVTDPEQVQVTPGASGWGQPYVLEAGENNFTIEEQEGFITIKAKSGFQINSVNDADGKPYETVEGYTNVYKVSEPDMVFDIVSGELQYDAQWVFWIDSAENMNDGSYWFSVENRGESNPLTAGYTVQPYASALAEQFVFSVYLKNGFYLYLNGEFFCKNGEYSKNCYEYFMPKNKIDVLRMYTTGEPAEAYKLTFTVSDDKAAATKVVTDLIVEQPEWADGLTLLEGTRVSLTLPADMENGTVKLDDTPLEADEDGNYVFDTTGDHNVTISPSSSILDLDVEKASDNNTVYNTLGVKVLENASASDLKRLPAGIYVINGQKRVVR